MRHVNFQPLTTTLFVSKETENPNVASDLDANNVCPDGKICATSITTHGNISKKPGIV